GARLSRRDSRCARALRRAHRRLQRERRVRDGEAGRARRSLRGAPRRSGDPQRDSPRRRRSHPDVLRRGRGALARRGRRSLSAPRTETTRSHALWEEARELFPGGVNSPVRAFRAVGGEPVFFERGEGPYLYDADGRRYVDLVGSWGPLILGHAPARVVAAAKAALEKGSSFGAPSAYEVALGKLVQRAMPSMERMRFVSSGTEAAMSALRLARAATRRDLIVKFEGCYHGHADGLLVAAGSGATTLGVPTSPGV